MLNNKIKREHLLRKAFLYIRQSTLRQLHENTESTKRQYALKEKLISLGWDEIRIEVIDSDLGQSGSGVDDRHGFQYLVSEVSLGRAGIVAGIEVSRLSRSSSDWNKLLQISALADTLIMDEDGIYNVNDFNDRLLLGLKGTLSEAELHYLKARMRGGLLNKAKRGELMRPLSIGYVYNDDGQIVKDPDVQVQEAISLFFNTFKRVGSARSVVKEYDKQSFTFPHRPNKGFKLGELTWKKLSFDKTLQTLCNPLYAGIYAYGQKQIYHTLDGRRTKTMPREQYHAWLTNSHPSYISEAEFDENNRILAQNMPPKRETEHGGAVREGSALLQGIALCGICGRKMTLRYSRAKHITQPIYQCQYEFINHNGERCQSVPGGNIDRVIGNLLLASINPITTDAALSIQREMAERKEEILRLYSQQVERTRYEMELAKRRYLRVDPDNRLVASELEVTFETAKAAYEQKCEMESKR
jgi:DNA invertase Pin-like site-specific DNA recombinase